MKKFKSRLSKIVTKIVDYLLDISFKKGYNISEIVRKYYILIRKKEFNITTKIVPVKKGKRKYTLLFFETAEGKYRVNIGRHNHKTISVVLSDNWKVIA